jgi:transcription antitermination factor NusG
VWVHNGDWPWFGVHVRARYEKIAATILRGKGYEEYLPVYVSRRRWSDRQRNLELPLFPGYLFCRLNPENRLPVLVTPGVIQIVGAGKVPIPVDPAEILAIQKVVSSGAAVLPWPRLEPGDKVRVEEGPLRDTVGVLLKYKNSHRLIVGVTLLQRSVAVEIDRNCVAPAERRTFAAGASHFSLAAGSPRQFQEVNR